MPCVSWPPPPHPPPVHRSRLFRIRSWRAESDLNPGPAVNIAQDRGTLLAHVDTPPPTNLLPCCSCNTPISFLPQGLCTCPLYSGCSVPITLLPARRGLSLVPSSPSPLTLSTHRSVLFLSVAYVKRAKPFICVFVHCLSSHQGLVCPGHLGPAEAGGCSQRRGGSPARGPRVSCEAAS